MMPQPVDVARISMLLNLFEQLNRLGIVTRLGWLIFREDQLDRNVNDVPGRLNEAVPGNVSSGNMHDFYSPLTHVFDVGRLKVNPRLARRAG